MQFSGYGVAGRTGSGFKGLGFWGLGVEDVEVLG